MLRLAASDVDQASALLEERRHLLSSAQAAWAWAYIGRQAAFRLSPDAPGHYKRALDLAGRDQPVWSDETLLWGARTVLRATQPRERWPLLLRVIAVMSAAQQADPAWVYWKARALQATAREGAEGDTQRAEARRMLEGLAGGLHFYAQLASEDLGLPPALPPAPPPVTAAERDAARATPGLSRALKLAELGLRDEAQC